MGCAASVPDTAKRPSKDNSSNDQCCVSTDQAALRAQESAARLAAMMKEIEEEKANEKGVFSKAVTDQPLALAALQKLWYGVALKADGLLHGMDYQDCLQSTKCIAAADGLTAMEAQWLRDRCVLLGLNSTQINTLFNLDARLEGDEVAQQLA